MKYAMQDHYNNTVVAELQKRFQFTNKHLIPRIEKIIVNSCVGKADDRSQAVDDLVIDLQKITGQAPIKTKARKSISNFKLRKGEIIGAKVTLRGSKMYDFLLRLVSMSIPSIRDFRGLNPRSFDGRGNYTLGILEQTIFPEIELDKIKRNIGFDITFATTTDTDEHALALLELMGMPFRK